MLLFEESISENIIEGAETVSENLIEQVTGAVSANIIEQVEEVQENLSVYTEFIQDLPNKLIGFGIKFVIAILVFCVGSWIISIIRKIVKKGLAKKNAEVGLMQFLDSFIKVCLYIFLIIFLANCFGFQTTSLIALLGSAGVAFALALQGSLSNFTGGVLILLLRPFKVGDYIIEDNKGNEGTVIEIQLFYTKLRTVDDKIVIIPNGALANSSLTNLNLSPFRRIIVKVGISYGSDIKKAKQILERIVAEEDRKVENSLVDVFVDELGSSEVVLCVRFFVENENYFPVKWDLLENIKLTFDKEGIEIPFSQLDVHMKNEN